ncbi:MAG: hypothetical protein AAF597_20480, partial [Bacteroidota bacterium]
NPLLIYPVKDRLLDADSLRYYGDILQREYSLTNARIVTDTSFTANQMAGIQGKLSNMANYGNRIAGLEQKLTEVASNQTRLASELEQAAYDKALAEGVTERLKLAFPGVEVVHLARMAQDSTSPPPLVALQRSWPGRRPSLAQRQGERQRMQRYLQSELKADTVYLVIEDN